MGLSATDRVGKSERLRQTHCWFWSFMGFVEKKNTEYQQPYSLTK